ncbi:hypothetical protein KOW79_007097 [Hemibagrus wyckioides]|uniref:Rab-GAP TBC domain-containing protein n=1 Tax=Hemibagrus wyckioides TaxID=337641 RepID=A0A9D3SRM0_9TELE|nr:hypothetical protein KOW79_007097 [Hemibagrus wyckioides]
MKKRANGSARAGFSVRRSHKRFRPRHVTLLKRVGLEVHPKVMSLRSDQIEDGESTSGSSEAKTDRYGFLLVNGDTNNDSDDPCPELVRHREMKWINLMSQWDQVLEKKHSKIKAQCQKGIPASVRSKCWPLLCGATQRKENNKDLYNTLESSPGQQSWIDVIKRDTDRQFPFHEMFQSEDSPGQQGLLQVLKAYTQFRPDEGYCQAQGPVAAVLLMHMPMEEAFWCLVQISELYLPGYYSPLLEGVLFDAAILFSVLKRTCPAAYKHMKKQGVEPLMFATDWLMCLYSRHLPFNTLLRVWDLFFCNGVRVLFQVAVVLVRRCLGEARHRKECEGQVETLERLRSVKCHVQHEQADAFIQEVCSVPLSLADLQRQTEKELGKWRKERPGSTFDPRDRCHGYYMIWEKGKERVKENEKKERQSGNLRAPVMRSHSSLSPAILRKKWRKRGSKTENEEWEGRGFTKQDSDDEEKRRASVCGVAGELRVKTQKTPPEFSKQFQKESNTSLNTPRTSATETLLGSELLDLDATVFEEDENDMVVIPIPLHIVRGDRKEETKPPTTLKEDDSEAGDIQQEIEKQQGTETWQDEEKKEQDPRDEEISSHQDQAEPQQEQSQPSQLEEVEDARNKPEQETQENTSKQEEETEIQTCEPVEEVQLNINTQEEDVQIQVNTDKQEEEEQENGAEKEHEEMDSSKQEEEIGTKSQEPEVVIHLDIKDEQQQQEDREQKNEVGHILETEEEMHSNVLQTPEDQKDAEDQAPSVQEEEHECCESGSSTDVEKTRQEPEGEREEARTGDAPEEETEGTVMDGEKGEPETVTSSPCVQPEMVTEHSGESETPQDSNQTQDENIEVNKTSTPEQEEPDKTGGSSIPESPHPVKKEEEVEREITAESNPVKPAPSGANQHPQLRLRRSSSSHTSYPTILSEDTFRDPQQNVKRDSCSQNTEAEESDIAQPKQTQSSKQEDLQKPKAQTKSDKPKRKGLFQRLRADMPSKSTIPKIVIQDFSEGEEKLSSKERRRRRRMQERKEKEEEKERKKLEKELEKEKERERKKPQTRGKSFQVLSKKHDDYDDVFSEKSDSQEVGHKRTSYSESYF